MTLAELAVKQAKFDSQHNGKFNWNENVSDKNIEMLEFLILALTGEVGETANIVKKIIRGDFLLSQKYGDLKEEITDVFIYVLKLSNQLGFDLEEEYLKKMKINQERFINYENETIRE